MAQDNISNIIDIAGFQEDLQKVIQGIESLESKIEEINKQPIDLKLDLQGAGSLSALTAAIEKQQDALNKLNDVQAQNQQVTQQVNDATQKYNVNVNEIVVTTANASKEVRALASNLQFLEQAHARQKEGTAAYENTAKAIENTRNKLSAYSSQVKVTQTANAEASKSFNILGVSMDGAERILGRMVVRMVAYQLIIAPVVAGIGIMVSKLFELSEAQKQAADMAKKLQDITINSEANAQKEYSQAQAILSIAKDVNQSMDVRLRAVKELQDEYPDYLGNLSKEAILAGNTAEAMERLNNALINKSISEAASSKVGELAKKYLELQDQLDAIEQKRKAAAGGPLTPVTQANINIVKQGDADIKMINDKMAELKRQMDKYQDEANRFATKAGGIMVDKDKKGGATNPSKSGLEEDINAENARFKNQQLLNKQAYDESRRTLQDELDFQEKEKQAALEHGAAMVAIIKAWHGKIGEDEEQYKTRLDKANNDQIENLNKVEEAENRVRDTIAKRSEQANQEAENLINKLKSQRDAISQVQTDIDNILSKKSGKKSSAWLPSFGEGDNSQEIDEQIEKARNRQNEIQAQQQQPNISSTDFTQLELEGTKESENITNLENQKQAENDQDILDAKRQLAQKEVEIVQQTVSSIITIKNNEFQHENDLLDKQARNVQLNAQQQIQAINASTGYAIQKQNQLSLVNAQAAAQENAIEMKKRQLAVEQARFNRSASEAQIVINTAVGITKSIAEFGLPIAIPLIVATAALGAIEFAAASSAPIPTYAEGTENHPGGLAIIGEAGQREFVQTPSGKSFWSESTATLLNLEKGSKVTPMDEMINLAARKVAYSEHSISNVELQHANSIIYNVIAEKIKQDREYSEEQTDRIVAAIYQTAQKDKTADLIIAAQRSAFNNPKRLS